MKEKEVRAVFDQETITVYQAYRPEIAIPAVKYQKFVSPFKLDRMTWIKPSFLWMMYRCGWTLKEGQEHVLAIKIKREGWEWAIHNACISHFDPSIHTSKEEWKQKLQNAPVRIQWDPERNINLDKLEYRAIQVGLSGEAVLKYVNEWIVEIKDISEQCRTIHQLVMNNEIDTAKALLPQESVYGY
ncbi:DUF4291 domain-containing protein [Flammeovirga sp. OC4]|uniref:DUF4291 domain-containing protein n=1 Tax=Flammeovirga sp. OC4 TaxID=1382345 RepID=UPI0005C45799|nr:DUF4291 domain-containing protein [Flammeovirga sp. OC4]